MDIQATESEDLHDLYKTLIEKPQKWEIIGRITLISCLLIALSAFIPALWNKKKRTYQPLLNTDCTPLSEIEIADVTAKPNSLELPRCTPIEKEKIIELFGTLAKGMPGPLTGWRLHQLGKEIDHVHPFSLLLVMPKDKITQIFKNANRMMISNIINGIQKGMERELKRNKIHPYIPIFSSETHKEAGKIKQLILAADWKGFARYVLDIPVSREG